VLILLPPSRGQAAPPRRSRPADLAALSFPELTPLRRRLLDALADAHAGPALPAHTLYTGVLYSALDWPSLDPAARRRGNRRLLIASGLWGLLRPGDRVPPYRLLIEDRLGEVGTLAAFWRPALVPVIAAAAGGRGLLVDCRSGGYAAAAPLTGQLGRRSVAVRVLQESAGRRTVVSHFAKHTRGELARFLLERDDEPRTPAALAEAVRERWPKTELEAPARAGATWTLSVVQVDG
jgi:cytoplasmic iron level regulating protein YaaA (DUF328/UPF0246 family)